MPHSYSTSRGCGTCGGSHRPAAAPPVHDPCAGGLAMTARPREPGCGCGRGAACTCAARGLAPTKNYHREDCPTFAISCETKQAVRDCVKVALCDLLRCVTGTLCPDGRFDLEALRGNEKLRDELIECLGQAACSLMTCLPGALCPAPCELPAPVDCLPCDYAVEVVR